MATARFLKILSEITTELDKERMVLVRDETKIRLLPMRGDKVRAFFGVHATATKDDATLTTEFAGAYYKLPLMGRAVLALRYGLFSGVEMHNGAVQHLTGVNKQEVAFIEARSRQRIYSELGITAPQEPRRPVSVYVRAKKKIRRDARELEGKSPN
jgi:hypothetical protein